MDDTGPNRHVELDGCCNFRDLGGYETTDGRSIRWGVLFRSDGLTHLTDADRSILEDRLGVRTVIDLRTELEVESRGRFRESPVSSYHHLPLTDTLPGAEQAPEWDDTDFVSNRYHNMVRDRSESIASAVSLLSDPGNLPAVFHCSVGKDRTGVLAAVVLGLLGVPDEVIVDDYTLSKPAMYKMLERLERQYPDSADVVANFAPVILSVEASSMTGFLDRLRQSYGSFEGLARSLGLDGAVPKLRDSLLA